MLVSYGCHRNDWGLIGGLVPDTIYVANYSSTTSDDCSLSVIPNTIWYNDIAGTQIDYLPTLGLDCT